MQWKMSIGRDPIPEWTSSSHEAGRLLDWLRGGRRASAAGDVTRPFEDQLSRRGSVVRECALSQTSWGVMPTARTTAPTPSTSADQSPPLFRSQKCSVVAQTRSVTLREEAIVHRHAAIANVSIPNRVHTVMIISPGFHVLLHVEWLFV